MTSTFFAALTGGIGIVVLTVSALPQVVHSFRKGTRGLSYAGSVAVVAVDFSWFIYAVFATIVAAMIADFIGTVLSATILFLVAVNAKKSLWWTTAWVGGLASIMITVGLVHPLLVGFTAATVSFVWRTLQLRSILVSPDISGVSLPMWVVNSAGVATWGVHGIFIGDTFLTVSCLTLGAYAAFIAAVVFFKRRNGSRSDTNAVTAKEDVAGGRQRLAAPVNNPLVRCESHPILSGAADVYSTAVRRFRKPVP